MFKKVLWAIVVVALLATTPLLLERSKVEKANNTYDIVIPYSQLEELGQWLSLENVLAELREAGLQTVSIEPVNLFELERKEYVLEVARSYLVATYPDQIENIPDTGGLYYRIVKDHPFLERIFTIFDQEYYIISEELNIPFKKVEQFQLNNEQYIFIPSRNDLRLDSAGRHVVRLMKQKTLGYDFEPIELLQKHGFSILPRIPNDYNFVGSIENHYFYDEFLKLTQYGDQVLFLGGEVTGFPYPKFLGEMAQLLKENEFEILIIEGNPQKGMGHLLSFENLDEHVVRLFSPSIKGKGHEGDPIYVNQTVRAFNERNIRVVHFNLLNKNNVLSPQTYNSTAEAKFGLEGAVSFVSGVIENPRNTLIQGQAEPFQILATPVWMKPIVYLGGLAFVTLFFLQIFTKPWLVSLATGGFALVLLAQLITGHHLLMKAIVLFIALIGPVFAIMSVRHVENWPKLIAQYFKSALIALYSAWFVISVLYGTEYLVKLDAFTGVKVLSIVPLFVVAFLVVQKMMTLQELIMNSKQIWWKILNFLKGPVKYWHLLVFVIIGAGVYFYIGRTGNQGILLPGELIIRQWLEESLAARPRTTEFLIGFPMFVLGLYGVMLKKKWASFVLIIGALGFSSMVGTFTHLHTPLDVSLMRTANSLTLGFAIGLVLVIITSYIENKVKLAFKERT